MNDSQLLNCSKLNRNFAIFNMSLLIETKMFWISNNFLVFFICLDFESCSGEVKALLLNKEFVSEVPGGEKCGIVLDQTGFYAEAGGQIYDQGYMSKVDDEEVEFAVMDVQVHGGYVLHVGALEGTLKVGDKVKCFIDEVRSHIQHYINIPTQQLEVLILIMCSNHAMF